MKESLLRVKMYYFVEIAGILIRTKSSHIILRTTIMGKLETYKMNVLIKGTCGDSLKMFF